MKKDIIYDQWLPFDGDYEKQECDIKLHNDMVLKHYYPNAGQFNAMCDLQDTELDKVDASEVKEVMYKEYYMQDLCAKENHACNGVPDKKKLRKIGVIGNHPGAVLQAAMIAAANQHHMPHVVEAPKPKAEEMLPRDFTVKDMVQPYDGPKPPSDFPEIELPKYEFAIMPNEQTPAVPEMSIEELLGHKEVLLAFLGHASRDYKTAIGLAANQVGLWEFHNQGTRRYHHKLHRFMYPVFAKKNRETGEWSLVLNPKIIATSGLTREKKEYCLTWPGKVIVADRVYSVTVEYYTIDGEKKVITAEDFEAQIWQHEINHLLGIDEVVVNGAGGIEHSKEPGRNDLCPCGSGKKYKKCKPTHTS